MSHPEPVAEHVDVIIVGAGLSGVGAASHLTREHPGKSVLILESRSAVGGTWDLFRYPGVRSDSDMFTLGYSFRPWTDAKAIADGASIHDYIVDTIADEGLGSRIRLNHRVISAEWSRASSQWTVTAVRTTTAEYTGETAETVTFTCSFLSVCSGYYRYDEGYTPAIAGSETFAGALVHPQRWPADLDYTGKRVVVIGSGATAVTLVPTMAATAAHVTMLQRSPTYIAPVPSRDKTADRLRRALPQRAAYGLVRAKNVAYSTFTYQLSRRRPELMKSILRKAAVARLPQDFDAATHLTPSYNPWDQRLCAIPDADLFRAISRGSADIVTDTIDRIEPDGIRLRSGATLPADVIVTATGLNLLVLGGIGLSVDGRAVDVSRTLTYKGMMLSDVPNFAFTIGYTNASWTLKADLVAEYVCRLLAHLDRHGLQTVTPHADDAVSSGELAPLIDFSSGYVLRSVDAMPKQGAKAPWRLHQNYVRDFGLLRWGRLTDSVSFGRADDPVVERDPLERPGAAFATIGGVKLRYRVTGGGEPLLLVHGIGRSLEDWDEQHDRLAERHTVYSLDLPGFGYSERMPGTAALESLAGVLPAFLDAVGVTGPIPVVGNSLGGAVAMTFAANQPERVSALVLANSAGFGAEVTRALRLLAIRPVGAVLMRPDIKNSSRTVRALFSDKAFVTRDRVHHAYSLSRRDAHRRTLLEVSRGLGTFRGVRPEWRAALLTGVEELGIPVLVVWGDEDRILPAHHLQTAVGALPHAESHLFERTGHMPQIERADEFAALVEDFVARSTAVRAEV